MARLDLIVPARPRRWQVRTLERLRAAGHEVGLVVEDLPQPWSRLTDLALALERALLRRPPSLADRVPGLPATATPPADIVIDLTGRAAPPPRFTLAFGGAPTAAGALATLGRGGLPDLTLLRDGIAIRHAAPMVDVPASATAALDDVLARAITLVTAWAESPNATRGAPAAASPPEKPAGPILPALLGRAWPRLLREVYRRARYRPAHWRVGYRFIDGPGVAETGALAGAPWSVLPDDGTHFYADPFAIELDGRHFLFVEDYPHATGKAVISVVEFDGEGRPSTPQMVLEEAHHLSYPQVLARDGGIFMLPEASASRMLTLYRATRFPHTWEPYAVLVADREISDATLLERDGRHWLFATDRDGAGSTSDTLVVYSAPRLEGPWTPHRRNPILIDRARARPGGAIVDIDGRAMLPVQDGTLGYGGGLGLSEITRLDDDGVELAPPVPVAPGGNWPYPRIHTLNRAGRLEVIDGIAEVPRR